jgi:hypothetical protein
MSTSSRHEILELREAPCRRQASNIERFFKCERDPKQGLPLPFAERCIGRTSTLASTLEVTNDNRIEAFIQGFNACDGVFKEFRRGNSTRLQRRAEFLYI